MAVSWNLHYFLLSIEFHNISFSLYLSQKTQYYIKFFSFFYLGAKCTPGEKKISHADLRILRRGHFSFRKIPENFPEENFLICRNHGWEGEKKMCNSTRSRIANLTLSSGASTSNPTIKTKSSNLKLST